MQCQAFTFINIKIFRFKLLYARGDLHTEKFFVFKFSLNLIENKNYEG